MKILMKETVRRNMDGKRYSLGNTYELPDKVAVNLLLKGFAVEADSAPVAPASAASSPKQRERTERTPEQKAEAARERAETIARRGRRLLRL